MVLRILCKINVVLERRYLLYMKKGIFKNLFSSIYKKGFVLGPKLIKLILKAVFINGFTISIIVLLLTKNKYDVLFLSLLPIGLIIYSNILFLGNYNLDKIKIKNVRKIYYSTIFFCVTVVCACFPDEVISFMESERYVVILGAIVLIYLIDVFIISSSEGISEFSIFGASVKTREKVQEINDKQVETIDILMEKIQVHYNTNKIIDIQIKNLQSNIAKLITNEPSGIDYLDEFSKLLRNYFYSQDLDKIDFSIELDLQVLSDNYNLSPHEIRDIKRNEKYKSSPYLLTKDNREYMIIAYPSQLRFSKVYIVVKSNSIFKIESYLIMNLLQAFEERIIYTAAIQTVKTTSN